MTPRGLIIFETVNLEGEFTYTKGKWKEKMTLGRALRYIVEEHLGDPIKSAQATANALHKKLSQFVNDENAIPIKPVVVFVHPHVTLNIESAPIPVCKVDQLKKHLKINGQRISQEDYEQIRKYLDSLVGA